MIKAVVNVTCAIIINSSKVFAAQRGEQMLLPLKWEFPGGKVQESETEEECVLREIKEELNIDIEIIRRLENSICEYEEVIINLIPFVCCYKFGDILLTEHRDAKWFYKEDLLTLDWAAADIPIVNQLLKSNDI